MEMKGAEDGNLTDEASIYPLSMLASYRAYKCFNNVIMIKTVRKITFIRHLCKKEGRA